MKTYIVDAFTSEPFKGNPAGICFPDRPLSDNGMLLVAKELGFSETAFISDRKNDGSYDLRFWTPQSEIALCGHATLGSGKVMLKRTGADEVRFVNIQGIDLITRRAGDQVAMEFPVYDVVPAEVPPSMVKALGISRVLNAVYNAETYILMLEIESHEELAALRPDYAALLKTHDSIDGVLVTAKGNAEYDFYSRYFWPWKGTNEDPVTGATHTFMTKYWSERLGKTRMKAFQASARTGIIDLELKENKLIISGHAVVVLEGEIFI